MHWSVLSMTLTWNLKWANKSCLIPSLYFSMPNSTGQRYLHTANLLLSVGFWCWGLQNNSKTVEHIYSDQAGNSEIKGEWKHPWSRGEKYQPVKFLVQHNEISICLNKHVDKSNNSLFTNKHISPVIVPSDNPQVKTSLQFWHGTCIVATTIILQNSPCKWGFEGWNFWPVWIPF